MMSLPSAWRSQPLQISHFICAFTLVAVVATPASTISSNLLRPLPYRLLSQAQSIESIHIYRLILSIERECMQKLLIPFRMSAMGWLLLAMCILFGIVQLGPRPGAVEGALVIVCLLLHEVGHMLTAVALGVPVREFGLCGRGAYNRRAHSGRRRTEILISFSGPLMNLCLVFPSHYLPVIGNQLALYNLILGIVNLLPIPSSDGLRILRTLRGSTADRTTLPSHSEVRSTIPVRAE
jgi:hypothetical protein